MNGIYMWELTVHASKSYLHFHTVGTKKSIVTLSGILDVQMS
jgi:uncharacterized protein (DUF111 family)